MEISQMVLIGITLLNTIVVIVLLHYSYTNVKKSNNERIIDKLRVDNIGKEIGEVHKLMYETEPSNPTISPNPIDIDKILAKLTDLSLAIDTGNVITDNSEIEDEVTFESPYVLSLASKYDLSYIRPCYLEGVDFIYFNPLSKVIELIYLDTANRKVSIDLLENTKDYKIVYTVLKEKELGITDTI